MHVVVLGAGYAGIAATLDLELSLPSSVDITLVDERETHLVQHLVHRVVRKPALADRLEIPLDELLDRADHKQAHVTGYEPDEGVVECAEGSLSFDVGLVCLGAETAFYGIPGVREHATPLKRLDHARQIREAFEGVPNDGRVVVCGAGLSGVQIAGELTAMADAREESPDVLLLEQQDTVVPAFGTQFQTAVAEELRTQGVTVRTGTTVTGATAETVELERGGQIEHDQLVWTGGITGGKELGESRPQVRSTLRLGERTFGAGDAVSVTDDDGQSVPASAQTAVRQADVAATNATKLISHQAGGDGFEPRLDRYRYEGLGWVVSVGDGTVASVGGSVVRGSAAKAVKTTVAAGYLGRLGAVESATEYVAEQFE